MKELAIVNGRLVGFIESETTDLPDRVWVMGALSICDTTSALPTPQGIAQMRMEALQALPLIGVPIDLHVFREWHVFVSELGPELRKKLGELYEQALKQIDQQRSMQRSGIVLPSR